MTSMHQSIPAVPITSLPPPPHPNLPMPTPGYWHFFSLDDKFSGQRLLSYQLPCSGDEKRGQMPSPQSKLQLGVSALIGQSSCVTLNILMLIFVSVNVCLCNSANAQPPGSAKVANAPPHGLTRWAQYRVHAASLVAWCSLRQVKMMSGFYNVTFLFSGQNLESLV